MTKLHMIAGPGTTGLGDLIFVHGLGGDPFGTWGLGEEVCWSTWLYADRPDLNVWSLGYEIHPTAWTGTAMPLADRGINVLAALSGAGLGMRPICFIAHSMGGLLVKQLLRHASTFAKEYAPICGATRAIVFFSTPHAGSEVASLASYLRFVLRPTVALDELPAHEPRLRELNLWFRNNVSDLNIACKVFYETRPTRGVVVVDATSADPGIPGVTPVPIDADHLEICHPECREDLRYLETLRFLSERLAPAGAPGEDTSAAAVSSLRQRLLLAHSSRDLRRLLHETEAIIAQTPHDPEALVLRDDVRLALVHEESDQLRASSPVVLGGRQVLRYQYRAGPSLFAVILWLLVVAGLIYGVYSLITRLIWP